MLLWMDGFDHYGSLGTGATNMTAGSWAEVDGLALWRPTNTNPRTGTYAIRCNSAVSATGIRRVLGAAKTRVGLGYGIYVPNLPNVNDRMNLMTFSDAANVEQVSLVLQSTGAIAVKRGGTVTGTLLDTSTALMPAQAYNHLECWVTFSNSVGTVEIRLNGVTITNLTGQDTVATSNVECSQVSVGRGSVGGSGVNTWDVDDIFCADNSGSQNNTFIGDQRVWTIYPNADTEEADWVPNSGTVGFNRLNEVSPDGDTTYIAATAIPESSQAVSEFGLDNLPAEVSAVTAVMVQGMIKKTDAGTCSTLQSVVSGGKTTDGAVRAITTAYTYYQDVFELDPNGGAPWTKAAVDAMDVRWSRVL